MHGVNRLRVTRAILPAMQFQLRKIGHVVLNVADLDRAVAFYTGVLGLEVSDRYPDSMVPGGMVFLRCNTDHHGVALVGGARRGDGSSLASRRYSRCALRRRTGEFLAQNPV